MHSVPSKLFRLDASSAKPLSRILVLSSLAMALHTAPAFAADVCKSADLDGAYVYSVDATSRWLSRLSDRWPSWVKSLWMEKETLLGQ